MSALLTRASHCGRRRCAGPRTSVPFAGFYISQHHPHHAPQALDHARPSVLLFLPRVSSRGLAAKRAKKAPVAKKPPRTSPARPPPTARPFQPTSSTTSSTIAVPRPRSGDEDFAAYSTPLNATERDLANRPTPTTIYTYTPSTVSPLIEAGLAGVIGVAAIANLEPFFYPTPGLWWFIPYLSLAYNVPLLGIAAWLVLRRRRPIHSIVAERAGSGLRLTVRGTHGPKIPILNLRLWEAPVTECSSQDLVLRKDLLHNLLPLSPRARSQLARSDLAKDRRGVDPGSSPGIFVSLRLAFASVKRWFRYDVLMEDTTGLYIKGNARKNRWSLNTNKAWMLDEGRVLDGLLLRNPDDIKEARNVLIDIRADARRDQGGI